MPQAQKLREELKSAQESSKALGKQLEEAKAAAAAAAGAAAGGGGAGEKEKQVAEISPDEVRKTETYQSFVKKAHESNTKMIDKLKKAKADLAQVCLLMTCRLWRVTLYLSLRRVTLYLARRSATPRSTPSRRAWRRSLLLMACYSLPVT